MGPRIQWRMRCLASAAASAAAALLCHHHIMYRGILCYCAIITSCTAASCASISVEAPRPLILLSGTCLLRRALYGHRGTCEGAQRSYAKGGPMRKSMCQLCERADACPPHGCTCTHASSVYMHSCQQHASHLVAQSSSSSAHG